MSGANSNHGTTKQQPEDQRPDLKQQQQRQQKPTDLHVVTENGEQCFMWRANQLTYIAQDRQELPIVLANKFGPLATKLDLSYNSLTTYKNIDLFTNLSELILDNNNLEDDHLDFKQNLRLKTLSLNKNKLVDLYKLVNSIKRCFPNLEFLSLIGNPLCPTFSSSFTPSGAEITRNQRLQLPDGGAAHRPPGSYTTTSVVVDGRHLFDLNSSNNNNTTTDLSCSLALADGKQTEFNYQKYRYFIIYHLPNLRFLDSSPIGSLERDEALRRFYWMQDQRPAAGLTAEAQLAFGEEKPAQRHNNNGNGSNSGTATAAIPESTVVETNLDDSQEAGFQLTIITNHHSDTNGGSQQQQQQQQQPSRGQSSSSAVSSSSNSRRQPQRYTLKLRFKVEREAS